MRALHGLLGILGAVVATATAQAADEAAWRYQWYDQGAELTRYELVQSRYGEARSGDAVLIYVTEPIDPDTDVKADNPRRPGVVPALKLNATRQFLTGIYPYTTLTTILQPIDRASVPPAELVSTSIQEWCGHVYTELGRDAEGWRTLERSYFESDGDRDDRMPGALTEDGLWTRLRINPDQLPTGDIELIPSTMAARLAHRPLRVEQATATLGEANGLRTYTISYQSIRRELTIRFEPEFPWYVQGWSERDRNHGAEARMTHRRMLPYWSMNGERHRHERVGLGLPADR